MGVWLVTGGTGFVGGWLVRDLARKGHSVVVVTRSRSGDRALRLVSSLRADGSTATGSVDLVDGDLDAPLCGLGPDVLARLARDVTVVVHAGAVLRPRTWEEAHRTNVEGTRAVLEVARRLPALRRFVHLSSIAVAGTYDSRFYEDWLDVGQRFRGLYAPSKYEAEVLVHEARDVPTLVVRPGSVVNDSRTGESWRRTTLDIVVDAFLRLRRLPHWTPLPDPFSSRSRFPVVPVDYVTDAIRTLVDSDVPPGRTFCLTESDPPTIVRLLEEIANRIDAPRFRFRLPAARALARATSLPALAPVLRRIGIRLDFLAYLDRPHEYDTANARAALEPRGVVCPPVLAYLDRVLDARR